MLVTGIWGFTATSLKPRDNKALPRTLSDSKVLELGGMQVDTAKHVHHRVSQVYEEILAAFKIVKDNIEIFEERYKVDLI